MIAAQDSSDGSDCAASLNYEDLFSVLMYYGHMSKDEILHSSRKFLYAIYTKYVDRACENLGVSPDNEVNNKQQDTPLTDDDYPSEFVSFTQAQREKYIKESNESDEDFIKKFSTIKRF